jgi:adenosine deaminase
MKKIELHLHIEGAAPPALIRSLAAEKKQDLSGIFDAQGAYSYSGFNDFLRVYEAATSVLTTPRDYARLLTEVLAEAAAHGAVYAELFVSPEFCGGTCLPGATTLPRWRRRRRPPNVRALPAAPS